jgi:hypothetical protein
LYDLVLGNETLIDSKDRYILKEDRGVVNAILIIEEARMEDRGDFYCVATNLASAANSTEAKVFVRVKGEISIDGNYL